MICPHEKTVECKDHTRCKQCEFAFGKSLEANQRPQTEQAEASNLSALLGPKHKGMRVSASGLLGRIRDRWKVKDHQRYVAGELLRHLEELAERFYGGDVKAVDEFLQLWDLDDNRP